MRVTALYIVQTQLVQLVQPEIASIDFENHLYHQVTS